MELSLEVKIAIGSIAWGIFLMYFPIKTKAWVDKNVHRPVTRFIATFLTLLIIVFMMPYIGKVLIFIGDILASPLYLIPLKTAG
jgi:hypothetical protein